MPDQRPAELAAQLRALADQVAALDTSAGGDTPAPGGARYPADVANLRPWKLTLPISSGGKVVEIRQPQLATYTDKYFGLTDAGDGIRFRCWHGGATTSGSSNPRSELREMNADGSDERQWSWKSGKHTIELAGQVNRLTKVKPHVVVLQIHGKDDDVTVARVEGNKLYLTKGDDTHAYVVDDNFQLGKRYTIKFEVATGKCSFWYNGVKLPYTVSSSDAASYFKAGCYAQTNPKSAPSESPDEWAEVVLYSVAVTHS